MVNPILSELLTDYSAVHRLKILSCYFKAVKNGTKTFEIRKNGDRGFQRGDVVQLVELDKTDTKLLAVTGNEVEVVITYVTNYEQKDDYVVFSFQLLEGE